MSGDKSGAQLPRPGDLLWLDQAASVQFAGTSAIAFRVIRLHDWATYDGWIWLDGYQLDRSGFAVERRTVFVRIAGLRRWQPPAAQPDTRRRSRPST